MRQSEIYFMRDERSWVTVRRIFNKLKEFGNNRRSAGPSQNLTYVDPFIFLELLSNEILNEAFLVRDSIDLGNYVAGRHHHKLNIGPRKAP